MSNLADRTNINTVFYIDHHFLNEQTKLRNLKGAHFISHLFWVESVVLGFM